LDQLTQGSCWPRANPGLCRSPVNGNPGQHRTLTEGVCELKIDFGPGYRVYYTERGGVLIVLLAGGDKSSQQKDIKAAISLAKNL
jgi:putative addiction module killer protein